MAKKVAKSNKGQRAHTNCEGKVVGLGISVLAVFRLMHFSAAGFHGWRFLIERSRSVKTPLGHMLLRGSGN
jgi:hypothetical protein